jgi:hypothetical protein
MKTTSDWESKSHGDIPQPKKSRDLTDEQYKKSKCKKIIIFKK